MKKIQKIALKNDKHPIHVLARRRQDYMLLIIL